MRDVFEDDDDDWQDMPVVRSEANADFDEEDQRRFKYQPKAVSTSPIASTSNATGNLIDFDDDQHGHDSWRTKAEMDEEAYTRLELDDDPDEDEIHTRTQYLFDDDKGMTPLAQMQATKTLLNEGQRIAYVGLCKLVCRELIRQLSLLKELQPACESAQNWSSKIMGRLYQHMEISAQEQRMIEQLAEHGVTPEDLVPSLATTHTIPNPDYDPDAAAEQAPLPAYSSPPAEDDESGDITAQADTDNPHDVSDKPAEKPTTIDDTPLLPGVSTTLTAADKTITLDIRWTILCDLFLAVIADSVYDARSRVLLLKVADKLGLGWMDVIRFERRLTDALELQEGVQKRENDGVIEDRRKAEKKKRYMMMGLATLGGGLVIGLSAGLLAPVIGAGLGAAFTTIGVGGTSAFLTGAGGAAVITTGGVVTGSSIAGKGMARRTKHVKTFEFRSLHNNKRLNVIVSVPGFMNGPQDDVRLPFSTVDPLMGDLFSIFWEPETLGQTGNALKILTTEVLTQVGQQVLQATILTALMSAIQWPMILTKLGYLIDNPWSNALDRARQAGAVLAQILIQRHLGVRPSTLVGFSLGARVIFYALVELAKRKAFGVVQEVYLMGATVTASTKVWRECRGVVSGRFVNAYAGNDWVLGYLFRATTGGIQTVAGLRPVEGVPDMENVDVTELVVGHMSYRTQMPVLLAHLGFRVTADTFDEPEDLSKRPEREVITKEMELKMQEEKARKKFKFGWKKKSKAKQLYDDDDLPPRESAPSSASMSTQNSQDTANHPSSDDDLPPRLPTTPSRIPLPETPPPLPDTASFDLQAIREEIAADDGSGQLAFRAPTEIKRADSAPPIASPSPRKIEPTPLRRSLDLEDQDDDDVEDHFQTPPTSAFNSQYLPPSSYEPEEEENVEEEEPTPTEPLPKWKADLAAKFAGTSLGPAEPMSIPLEDDEEAFGGFSSALPSFQVPKSGGSVSISSINDPWGSTTTEDTNEWGDYASHSNEPSWG